MPISPGLRAGFSHTVTDADTAVAAGSGDVPVLATPRVLALAERASVEAVAGALDAGATTVGARVELEHLRATPVGATVTVEAVLERVDDDGGRRLGVHGEQGEEHFDLTVRKVAGHDLAHLNQLARTVAAATRPHG